MAGFDILGLIWRNSGKRDLFWRDCGIHFRYLYSKFDRVRFSTWNVQYLCYLSQNQCRESKTCVSSELHIMHSYQITGSDIIGSERIKVKT